MATCRDIVTKGLKMAKVVGVNATPTASEADLGMDVLQSLYRFWFSSGEFGRMNEVYKEVDYTAKEQDRVTATTGVVITRPVTYQDGSDSYGDGAKARRAPFELAAIEIVQDGAVSSYIWERTAWIELNNLSLNANAPLSHYGDMGLAACFSMHYAETFGAQIGAGQKRLADRFVSAFRIRRNEAAPRTPMEAF